MLKFPIEIDTYKKRRDNAETKFDDLQFCETEKENGLNSVYKNTLARYDAAINWYDKHADRRRFWSGAVRLIAVVLGTISLLLINLRVFGSATKEGTATLYPDLSFSELSAYAVLFAIIAGGVLLLDLVFQITGRYGRWRVEEYNIRIMRTAFVISFLSDFGAKRGDDITIEVFKDAKIMATKCIQEMEKAMRAETESWSQNLDAAMKTLNQKIEAVTNEAQKASGETIKKAEEIVEGRLKREKDEKLKTEPVLLNITISKDHNTSPLTLVVEEQDGKEFKRFDELKPGQFLPVFLPPSPYILRLLHSGKNEIAAKSQRLTPAIDETLTI